MSKSKKPNYYVDKEELTVAVLEYVKEYKIKLESVHPRIKLLPEERPKASEYIGKAVYEICNRFSYSPSFINYPFREDMVTEAIITVLKYMHNFDPEKSRNPHSYFTQFAYFTFLQYIREERKKYHTKAKYVQTNQMHMDVMAQDKSEYAQDFGSEYYRYVKTLYDVELGEFDSKVKDKKNKAVAPVKEGPLDEFEVKK